MAMNLPTREDIPSEVCKKLEDAGRALLVRDLRAWGMLGMDQEPPSGWWEKIGNQSLPLYVEKATVAIWAFLKHCPVVAQTSADQYTECGTKVDICKSFRVAPRVEAETRG